MSSTQRANCYMKIYAPVLLIAGLLALGASGVQAQEVVGKFLMAIGKVEIERGDKTIPARKDTEILAGDTIATGTTSNAQVRFNDGAVIAFRPETEFRVDEYKYSGKPDGSEKATVSLLKGGVRAVTGAIGRSNRDNLKVNAVVATVGIRGTGFNITFCGAACKAANPSANEGLYAGVFEGKVAVRNEGGATSDLGVNRFAYVKDGKTAPILLIAPPSFLKDSLEGQVRIQPKALAINAASENAGSLQNANATVKAPATGGQTATISAEKVQAVPTPLTQIEVVNNFPSRFFENDVGDGAAGVVSLAAGSKRLRAAEYNPAGSGSSDVPADNEISLNKLVTALTYDGVQLTNVNTGLYEIKDSYAAPKTPAQVYEAGSSGGVISWGRWANGTANLNNYGEVTLERYQGWHYILGSAATSFAGLSSVNMTLIGGTKPTELRAGATDGWRLTGGNLAVNFSQARLSGTLLLYYGNSAGYGNFTTSFAGSVNTASPSALNGYSSSTIKTSGSSTLCTSSCSGNINVGFYGPTTNLHAGATYQINTGANGTVQGVAIYR